MFNLKTFMNPGYMPDFFPSILLFLKAVLNFEFHSHACIISVKLPTFYLAVLDYFLLSSPNFYLPLDKMYFSYTIPNLVTASYE